jgi:hypothetical protein
MNEPVTRRWNLFARELEDILTKHGLRLSQLDEIVRGSIGRKCAAYNGHSESPRAFPPSILMKWT